MSNLEHMMLSELANVHILLQPLVLVFDTDCLPVLHFFHLALAARPSERRDGETFPTRFDLPARLCPESRDYVTPAEAFVRLPKSSNSAQRR